MPKHKQKAKKAAAKRPARARTSFLRTYRKPLAAGLAVALVAVPAGLLAVRAEPVQPEAAAGPWQSAAAQAGGASGGHDTTTGAKASDAKKTDTAKNPKTAGPAVGAKAKAAPAPVPAPAPAPQPAPLPVAVTAGWHENITTTIFWVGETAGPDNAGISNAMSAWDGNWEANYGGYDDPDNRNGYYPAGFTPKENPFYFALPYNDLDENGNRKASASNCPNVGGSISWCKNAWIKIVKGGKTAYAQWQDVGPLGEDDLAYVFGTARPQNTWGAGAGLDVSPAVRDYLGLGGIDTVSWGFVSASAVPAGPWKNIVTTNPGGW